MGKTCLKDCLGFSRCEHARFFVKQLIERETPDDEALNDVSGLMAPPPGAELTPELLTGVDVFSRDHKQSTSAMLVDATVVLHVQAEMHSAAQSPNDTLLLVVTAVNVADCLADHFRAFARFAVRRVLAFWAIVVADFDGSRDRKRPCGDRHIVGLVPLTEAV